MDLTLDRISFSYVSTPVLRSISFDIPHGDFLTILGPNGSGKSTLLRLIDRILLPSEGSLHLDNISLEKYTRRDLAKIIGYVPQETNWIFPFTVLEAVLMGRSPSVGVLGFEGEQDIGIARKSMELMDIGHLEGKSVTALSGGERQRVLLARALAQQPRILLLDEPNAHLDLAHQLEMFRVLRTLNREEKLTVVSVSHDLNLAAAFSSRVLLLGSGPGGAGYGIHAIGTPQEVITRESISRVFHTEVTVDRKPGGSRLQIHLDV